MYETGSPSGEGTFEYGLQLILDGIRATLPRHATVRNDGQAATGTHKTAV
jgi:hypothetical protein